MFWTHIKEAILPKSGRLLCFSPTQKDDTLRIRLMDADLVRYCKEIEFVCEIELPDVETFYKLSPHIKEAMENNA